MGDVPLIDIWLPALMLPIRRSQPSLVLTAVAASFLVGFTITFCFVGIVQNHRPLATSTPPGFSLLDGTQGLKGLAGPSGLKG